MSRPRGSWESEEKPRSPSPPPRNTSKQKDALYADSLKRYRITRVIEPSLLGEILRAYDTLMKKDVVIKRSFIRCVENGRTINGRRTDEDLLEEIRIHSLIASDPKRSPFIIDQHDVFKDERYINVVLPYAPKDLFTHMETLNVQLDDDLASCPRGSAERDGLLKAHWKECHRIMTQLVAGTKYLHGRRIAHRDLSLENTLMDRDYNVKIIDFGMAKDYGRCDPPPKAISTLDNAGKAKVKAILEGCMDDFGILKSTARADLKSMGFSDQTVQDLISYHRSPRKESEWLSTKNPIGKTKYCSPECYIYMFYDGRDNDCWSLGVCLFMMLVGAPPYETPSRMDKRFELIYEKGYRGLEKLLNAWKRLERMPEHGLDLLALIFRPQKSRITIDEIAAHPYFTTGGCLPKCDVRPPRLSSIHPVYPPKTPDRELRRLVHDQRYKDEELKVPESWSNLRREVREQIVQAVVRNNQKSISTIMDKVFVKQLFRKVAVISDPWQSSCETRTVAVDDIREIIHWLWMTGWKPQSTNFFEEEKPDSDDEKFNAANELEEAALSVPTASCPAISPSQRQAPARNLSTDYAQQQTPKRETRFPRRRRAEMQILIQPQQSQETNEDTLPDFSTCIPPPDTIIGIQRTASDDDNKGKPEDPPPKEKPRKKSSFFRQAINGLSQLINPAGGDSRRGLPGFPLSP